MRSKISLGSVVVTGLLSSFVSAVAFADAPAPKWYDTIAMSGYLQGSYVANLNDPASKTNTDRQFDTNSDSFNFNTFLLQIAKPVGDSDHYGFTVRLRTGQDANNLPGGGNLTVQEAYMTYVIPQMTKLSLIGGKFVTPEGYEGVDTVNNPNFSEGLLFTFAEPITHTGIKANYMINDKANATIGVVNGWDVAPDNNDAKTILWQLATTPTKQISWSFQGLYGKELPDPTHSQRLSLDTVLGVNPTDKLSFNLQGNWGEQTNDPGTAAGEGTTHWDGLGFWASLATTSKFTEIARFEVLNDQNGADRFNVVDPGTSTPRTPRTFADGTTNQTVKEFTLTHKTMLTASLGNRLEYRHDWSNEAYFEKSDGSFVRNQNTISTDFFVLF